MSSTKINYIELPARSLEATKRFFQQAFGWEFVDYGPEYAAIQNAGLDGGFYQSDLVAQTSTAAPWWFCTAKTLSKA